MHSVSIITQKKHEIIHIIRSKYGASRRQSYMIKTMHKLVYGYNF